MNSRINPDNGMLGATPAAGQHCAIECARREEREACAALYDREDVLAPVGQSAWGEAYQEGWIAGAQAYRDAIRARGSKLGCMEHPQQEKS